MYWAVFRCCLASMLQYRSGILAAVATQIFWGAIKTIILIALYGQSDAVLPITLGQALTFIWLGQAIITLLPWDVDHEIEEMIRNGNFAMMLCRPMDMYLLLFTRSLALRLIPTMIRSAIVIAVAVVFFGLGLPVSWAAALAFGCSLVCASLVASSITAVVMTTLCWTLSGEGVQRILPHFTLLFSGLVIPLPLFPSWLQPLLNVQPLRCILDIPCRLYTGVIPASEAVIFCGFQLAWCALIVAGGRWLMGRALRRIEIQGG
jgi:ABC-2 type transport system permease protein